MSIYMTNAIEALNRLLRKTLKDPLKIPGALSDDGAAFKLLSLSIRSEPDIPSSQEGRLAWRRGALTFASASDQVGVLPPPAVAKRRHRAGRGAGDCQREEAMSVLGGLHHDYR
jgi:hypothetical protein